MESIKTNEKVLYVWSPNGAINIESEVTSLKEKGANVSVENVDRLQLASYQPSSFDVIVVSGLTSVDDLVVFGSFLKLLKPKGRLVVANVNEANVSSFKSTLTLSGFISISAYGACICGEKPNYEVGSFAKLSLNGTKPTDKSKVAAVWKITGDDAEEEEVINADDLLDEEDLVKPDPSSLRVCGTTGKRKACKDCSCGLADELAAEKAGVDKLNTAPKSSCGSCYLGDAFRCATCPYLGMPAFKPGEKIQLTDNLMKADL